jgi:hypothetical protein
MKVVETSVTLMVESPGKIAFMVKKVKHYAMKTYRASDVQIHVFFTLVLVEGEWSASRRGLIIPCSLWIGGWVSPRAGLDDMEKRKSLTPPGLELGHLGRPARSESLCRLRHPGFKTGLI